MMAYILFLGLLAGRVESHGAVNNPLPWNNDPTSTTIDYGIRLRSAGPLVILDSFNVDTCDPIGYQSQGFEEGQCIPPPLNLRANRPSYIYSLNPPAQSASQLIDCTLSNNCSEPATVDNLAAGQSSVWLTEYTDRECSAKPSRSYKMNLDTCTQLPTSGDTYPTVGCEGFACQWFSQGCSIGCDHCTGDENVSDYPKNMCGNSSAQPTLPDEYRTFNIDNKDPEGDWSRYHPWRAPGNAPVFDACGIAGGSPGYNQGPGGHPPPGHHYGDRGSLLPARHPPAVWKAGSTVEVSWGIAANHGGGYQYRLCPKTEALDEDCFQRGVLPFAPGGMQKLMLQNGTLVPIKATDVSQGTQPAGSVWRMNPVPGCKNAVPGRPEEKRYACDTPTFTPPAGCDATCWGPTDNHTIGLVLPSIIDELLLPADLGAGNYTLGFRWDCEQSPQVWSSCSAVTIE